MDALTLPRVPATPLKSRTPRHIYADAETCVAIPSGLLLSGADPEAVNEFNEFVELLHGPSYYEPDAGRDNISRARKVRALKLAAKECEEDHLLITNRDLDVTGSIGRAAFEGEGWKPTPRAFQFYRNVGTPQIVAFDGKQFKTASRPISSFAAYLRGKVLKVSGHGWIPADDPIILQMGTALRLDSNKQGLAGVAVLLHIEMIVQDPQRAQVPTRQGAIDMLIGCTGIAGMMKKILETQKRDRALLSFRAIEEKRVKLSAGTRAAWQALNMLPYWQTWDAMPPKTASIYKAAIRKLCGDAPLNLKSAYAAQLILSRPQDRSLAARLMPWLKERHAVAAKAQGTPGGSLTLWSGAGYMLLVVEAGKEGIDLITWDRPLN